MLSASVKYLLLCRKKNSLLTDYNIGVIIVMDILQSLPPPEWNKTADLSGHKPKQLSPVPLPELTGGVDGPSTRVVETGL